MNDAFKRAITAGIEHVAQVACDDFEHNGEVFKGSFKSSAVDAQMVMAGYNSSADYILRAGREQFAGTVPAERTEILWRGETFLIRQDMDPFNQFSWVAAVTRRSRA